MKLFSKDVIGTRIVNNVRSYLQNQRKTAQGVKLCVGFFQLTCREKRGFQSTTTKGGNQPADIARNQIRLEGRPDTASNSAPNKRRKNESIDSAHPFFLFC